MNSTYIEVHASHPQKRLVAQSAAVLERGGIIACPTDACYALICAVGNKDAEDRIRAIRHVAREHYFTLMCRDVSELAVYAKISKDAFRIIRTLAPGPYTFILPATRETPRRLQDPKRKMIGIRIPAHPVVQAMFDILDMPLMSSTLMNDGIDLPYDDAADIARDLNHVVDAVIDAGPIGIEMTTIIDMTGSSPNLVRQGKGDISRVPDFR
jgi:tRNA threonylcarbamoyl adenosine modification protein (Sua5/YciO/YrdC/YwlC family)